LLRKWRSANGEQFAMGFYKLKHDRLKLDRDTRAEIDGVDKARRLLAHYFQSVWALSDQKFIDDNVAKLMVSQNQAQTVQELIELLDDELYPESIESTKAYKYIRGLYNLPPWKRPMA
jgi:hypothetical protein